jgi:hypothetical protein
MIQIRLATIIPATNPAKEDASSLPILKRNFLGSWDIKSLDIGFIPFFDFYVSTLCGPKISLNTKKTAKKAVVTIVTDAAANGKVLQLSI